MYQALLCLPLLSCVQSADDLQDDQADYKGSYWQCDAVCGQGSVSVSFNSCSIQEPGYGSEEVIDWCLNTDARELSCTSRVDDYAGCDRGLDVNSPYYLESERARQRIVDQTNLSREEVELIEINFTDGGRLWSFHFRELGRNSQCVWSVLHEGGHNRLNRDFVSYSGLLVDCESAESLEVDLPRCDVSQVNSQFASRDEMGAATYSEGLWHSYTMYETVPSQLPDDCY